MRSISFVALMLLANLAYAQCENSEADVLSPAEALIQARTIEASDAEVAVIQAASRGESDSVFFIDIFGGLMPIPNRFVPFARSPGEFHSRNVLGSPLESLLSLSGSIRIGPIDAGSQWPVSPPEEFEACSESTLSQYGLTVVVWEFEGFSHVRIYDEEEFIVIADNNKQLWRAMMDAWNELPRDPVALEERGAR